MIRSKFSMKTAVAILMTAVFFSEQNAEAAKNGATKLTAVKVTVKQAGTKKVVKLSWKKKVGVKKYTVCRSVKKLSGYKKIATVSAKTSNKKVVFKDKTVKYGKSYYYKVKGKGLSYSKAVKVKIKTKTDVLNDQNASEQTAVTMTPVSNQGNEGNLINGSDNSQNNNGSENNIADNGNNNENNGNSGNDNRYNNVGNVNNDTMPTPVPLPGKEPVNMVDMSSLGTENEDYYVISDSGTSSEITEVADINSNTVNVKADATFVLDGTVSSKQIISETPNVNVILILNNAFVSAESEPFVNLLGENSNITISAVKGTTNTVMSASAADKVELIGSNGNVLFGGEGTINIVHESGASNAVKAEGEVRISNVSLNVTSGAKGIIGKPVVVESGNVVINASDDGIKAKGKNGFMLSGGSIDIMSSKDGINSNKLVQITDGTLKVNAGGDGIQCGNGSFNETDKVFEIDGGEVNIYGGTLDITSVSAGIKGNCKVNISAGNVTISSQAKGIKAGATYTYPEDTTASEYTYEQPGYLNIYGGTFNVTSNEHAFSANGNAADIDNDSAVVIKGGSIEAAINAAYTKAAQSTGGMGGFGGFGGMDASKTSYTVTGDDAIHSGTGIYISDALIKVNKSADAIQAKSNLYVYNSVVDVKAYGKGLKAGYITDSEGKGNLEVGGGTLTIISFDDCVHCNNNVKIAAGNLALSTADDGVHADNELKVGVENLDNKELTINVKPGTLDNVSISPYEGLEGAYIYVYSGDVDIESTDDGINGAGGTDSSGTTGVGQTENFFGGRPGGFGGGEMMSSSKGEFYMYGGDIYVKAQGDSIDINGNLEIAGGYVKIDGSDNGADDVLDYDGTLTVSGGTVMAAGKKGMEIPKPSGSNVQNNVVFFSSSTVNAGLQYKLTDASGNIIAEGTTLKQNSLFFFSDSRLVPGTYAFYINNIKKAEVTFSQNGESKQISF